MDVIEYIPDRAQYAYTFGGAPAAMRVTPGTALRLWSDDAFGGVLRSVDDLSRREGGPALREPTDRPVLPRGR